MFLVAAQLGQLFSCITLRLVTATVSFVAVAVVVAVAVAVVVAVVVAAGYC